MPENKFKFNEAQLEQLNKVQIHLHGYTLTRTCLACPEQWDVHDSQGNMVAYFRLRHGSFRVDVPDCGGETIFTASPRGDGIFDADERFYWLKNAMENVIEYYMEAPWYEDKW